jgi:hypothetical protein
MLVVTVYFLKMGIFIIFITPYSIYCHHEIKYISWQFLPPGGSMGVRSVFQFLFSEKSHLLITQNTIEASVKISTYLQSFEF